MSEEQSLGPIVTRLHSSGHDPSDGTISVMLGLDEEQGFQLNLHHTCIGAVITALSAEYSNLQGKLPPEEFEVMQSVLGNGIQIAETEDGSTLLLIHLVNGTTMPLQFRSGDLNGFAAELYERTAPPPSSRN